MNFEKKNDGAHVYVENNEGEFEVLRAIVQASFDSAIAVGMGMLQYDKSNKLNRNDAEKFIKKENWDKPNSLVVSMDYVGGRQCKTTIFKVEKNHFLINTYLFERDRGNIENMLNLAKEVIKKDHKSGEEVDSSTIFVGESLNKRLAEYGFERKENEDDWSFRKRVFPELMLKTRDQRSYEFLYGKMTAQWNEMESMLALVSMNEANQYSLKKFAEDFAADPLKMWPVEV